jgi:hypothetical protein
MKIIFAAKTFYDNKDNGDFGYIGISGTMTGKGLAYPNNTYAVSCIAFYKACFVSYVQQIGHAQIGRMENPAAYPIIKWSDYEVVARDEETALDCYRVTMTIDRKREELLWIVEPINQTKPNCKQADTNIQKYTIEDSPKWKQIFGKQ